MKQIKRIVKEIIRGFEIAEQNRHYNQWGKF